MAAVPLDAIEAQASEITPRRVVLGGLAWVFYWAGWCAAMLMTVVVWRSLRFVTASVMTGWKEAAGPSKRAQISRLKAELADRDMKLSRVFGQQ